MTLNLVVKGSSPLSGTVLFAPARADVSTEGVMAGGASLEGADAEHLIAFGLVMGATSSTVWIN